MSGPLALAIATAASAAGAPPSISATSIQTDTYDHAISIAIPSLDTGRGIAGSYEHWLPAVHLSIVISGEARESAIGDYTGLRVGTGGEMRWYWRAARSPWLSALPAGNMAGWFVGAGGYVAADFTHDTVDHKWLGNALQLGVESRIGYRIVPWRQLAITPSTGLESHLDMDLGGRLPGFWRGGLSVGLDVGWLF
jgi:hypothetical protein